MNLDRIILVDKPAGISSFGVVARVRRTLSREAGKKVKVGHTGTLDPFATGLMILVSGKETKNAGTFSKLDKEYEAVIRLGQTSSTGDPEGELTDVADRVPGEEEIRRVLEGFRGKIEQTPPVFSAIKVNGQRAYKLARKGEQVEIPKRIIHIYTLELVSYTYPELTIRTRVSSGTYIRSLAFDIGATLGTGAYTSALRRTKIARYSVADAEPIDKY